jgi:hypothetical protein
MLAFQRKNKYGALNVHAARPAAAACSAQPEYHAVGLNEKKK